MCLNWKRKSSPFPFSCFVGGEFYTVINVEIAGSVDGWNGYLGGMNVVFVAVDNGPQCGFVQRPPAGKNAIRNCRIKWFPLRAGEKACEFPLDRGHSSGGLRISRRESVPNPPDILPAFPSNAVKESEL